MWKFQKDEDTPKAVPANRQSAAPATPYTPPVRQPEPARPAVSYPPAVATPTANIGKSVVIKGQLSGAEDLIVDGDVEGSIDLPGNTLTIGPNGRIRANVQAREIIVCGKVNGNLTGEKIELRNNSSLVGDIKTQRIVIQDGAFFKGGIDIQKGSKSEPAAENQTSIKAHAAVAQS